MVKVNTSIPAGAVRDEIVIVARIMIGAAASQSEAEGSALRFRSGQVSAPEIAENFAVSLVPTSVTALMITTEIRPAMRPYSMAVTPVSSFAKRKKRFFMVLIPCRCVTGVDVRPICAGNEIGTIQLDGLRPQVRVVPNRTG